MSDEIINDAIVVADETVAPVAAEEVTATEGTPEATPVVESTPEVIA